MALPSSRLQTEKGRTLLRPNIFLKESHMKRAKYYDFLFDWSLSEKGHELTESFETKSKEYLAFLIKQQNEISNFPDRLSDPDFNNYKQGSLAVLKSAIDEIGIFLDYRRSAEKNHLRHFMALQEKYHDIYISLKKI